MAWISALLGVWCAWWLTGYYITPVVAADESQCRCRPTDPCWPSEEDWKTLNDTIHGNLVQVQPIGAVCHDPSYDKAACDRVLEMSPNATWRASQPGALQNYPWEISIPRNETCYVAKGGDSSQPCGQGRLPLYSAVVKSTEDIQTAIRFAKDKNLRLVIKNTGHDTGGRSSGVDSFQISTQSLKDITFTDNFVPSTNDGETPPESAGPAVTVTAGVLIKELYPAAATNGYTVVTGECGVIGAAGGVVFGAGVSSALAPMRGLVSDLVLEIEIVTAEGEVVVANQHQNQDLFWALRGGGGGTFGVATRVTMQVFEDIPVVVSNVGITTSDSSDVYWSAIKETFHKAQELLTDGNSGQLAFGRTAQGESFMNLTLLSFNEQDQNGAKKTFDPLLASLKQKGLSYSIFQHYPKLSSYLAIRPSAEPGGVGFYQNSILVPNELYDASNGTDQIIEHLRNIELGPGDHWEINRLGGQVNNNVDNALHEGWRSAALILSNVRYFGQSIQEQQAAEQLITTQETPALHSMTPPPVAVYLNAADPHLENWKDWFWGGKYERLLEVKHKWDPDDLFIVRHGVGSEEWDEDGMCRQKT